MKTTFTNIFKMSSMALLTLSLVQCSKEEEPAGPVEPVFPDVYVKTVDFVATDITKSAINAEGLVKFDAEDELQIFLENTADAATVWEDASYRYATNEVDCASGLFKAEKAPQLVEGANYRIYAMSPYSDSVIDPMGGEESSSIFSFDGQVQDCKNVMGHLTAYDIMTGVAENLTEGKKAELQMEHKSAMVYFKVENGLRKPVTIKSVTMTTPEGVNVGGTYNINFKQGAALNPMEPKNVLKLYVENASQLDKNGTLDVFFMTPAFTMKKGSFITLTITTTDNESWNQIVPFAEEKEFKAGNLNIATVEAPQFKVEMMWRKTANDMKIARDMSGMAMNSKYVAIQLFSWVPTESLFVLLDRKTGDVVDRIVAPNNVMMKVRTDDADHFVVSRENISGAGCVISYYDESKKGWKELLNYTAADGCPAELGCGLSVCGDVTKGDAHLYATRGAGHTPVQDAIIYHWGLRDGNRLHYPNKPETMNVSSKIGMKQWQFANIQRMSIKPDSDYYVSAWLNGASEEEAGAVFGHADAKFTVTPMAKGNLMYRLLDFQVVEVGGKRLMVTNEQGYKPFSGNVMRVYDITDPKALSMKPGDKGYEKFLIYQAPGLCKELANYNAWGHIGTHVEETDDAYIIYMAAGIMGFDTLQTDVRMYKMTWYK